MKRSLNKFLKTSRFAVRKDVIENLATTFLDWEEYRTDSGDLALKQVMERRDDGIAVIHVDGALAHRNSFEAVWFGEDTYQAIGDAFDEALAVQPGTVGDYFRCAYRSLALSYRNAFRELQQNTGRQYERIYIVGGGAKNAFLNRLTEEASGKTVIALPMEATAIGNLKIQMQEDERC